MCCHCHFAGLVQKGNLGICLSGSAAPCMSFCVGHCWSHRGTEFSCLVLLWFYWFKQFLLKKTLWFFVCGLKIGELGFFWEYIDNFYMEVFLLCHPKINVQWLCLTLCLLVISGFKSKLKFLLNKWHFNGLMYFTVSGCVERERHWPGWPCASWFCFCS